VCGAPGWVGSGLVVWMVQLRVVPLVMMVMIRLLVVVVMMMIMMMMMMMMVVVVMMMMITMMMILHGSRFGKFTQLQFVAGPRNRPLLVGSRCEHYLLEKSRVVHHSAGERNYHIFYQVRGLIINVHYHHHFYHHRPHLVGSRCEHYLLEKSRVVHHSAGERNYHIFYQVRGRHHQLWI
jgi:hypothetical protein